MLSFLSPEVIPMGEGIIAALITGGLLLIDVGDSKSETTRREAKYIIGDRAYDLVGDKQ